MSDVLDYELDDTIELDTPERLRAAADPLRALVLDLVLERAMSVTELAARVGRPRGTVAHHVDVLVETGLLKVVRSRKVRAMEERFYGRTARTIAFPSTGPGLPFVEWAAAEADLEAMEQDTLPSGFTLRHARIPAERAQEWRDRLMELGLEFSRSPRDGEVEYAVLLGLFPTTRRVAPRVGRSTKQKGAS